MFHGTLKNLTDSTRVFFDFRRVVGDEGIGVKDPSFFIAPGSRKFLKKIG